VIGLGLAEVLFLGVLIRDGFLEKLAKRSRWVSAIAVAVLTVILLMGVPLENFRFLRAWVVLPLAVATWIQLFFKPSRGLAAMAAFAALAGFGVNPVVRGGAELFQEMGLAKKVTALESSRPGSLWAVYQDAVIGEMFRVLGVRSVNGTNYYPKLEEWQALDPSRKYVENYNRFAHIRFMFPKDKREIRIETPHTDTVSVFIHPDHPAFKKLGITHFLVSPQIGALPKGDVFRCCRKIDEVDGFQVWEVGRSRTKE
jgi:hypothetical protein